MADEFPIDFKRLGHRGTGAQVPPPDGVLARFGGKGNAIRPTKRVLEFIAKVRKWGRSLGALWYTEFMVKTLEQAIAEIESLPASDQEQIGRKLLSHVEKLRLLREDIDEGVRSLDAGRGRELDVEDLIRRKNEQYGRS